MDAQGAEGRILRGAKTLLKTGNPKIIMEFWPYGLRNLGTDPFELLGSLQGSGYRIKVIDKDNRRLQDADIIRIIQGYERRNNGKGFVDLLLEREIQ